MFRLFRASLALAAALAVTSCWVAKPVAASEPVKPSPRGEIIPQQPLVSIKGEATLSQALEAVSRTSGLPVLCQAPQTERVLAQEVALRPLDEALNEISRSYHYHWLRTPTAIVLIRRLWDQRETLDLEIEEFQAIGRDGFQLLRPFVPSSPYDLSPSVARRDFYNSLSPQQLQWMQQKDGMPFEALTGEQRSHFLHLSTQNTYESALVQAQRAKEAFSVWDQNKLRYKEFQSQGMIRKVLSIVFPSPSFSPGTDGLRIKDQYPEESGVIRVQATGEVIAGGKPRRERSLAKEVRITKGQIRLGTLLNTIGTAVEGQIQAPEWANERQLLVFSPGASAGALLDGLALMYGWELQPVRHRQWRLDRRPVKLNPTFAELHTAVQELLPPVMRLRAATQLQVPARHPDLERAFRYQQRREFYAVMAAIRQEAGSGWNSVRIGDLSPALRKQVANHLAPQFFEPLLSEALLAEPRKWLLEMERGFLTLRGEVGKGKNPELSFALKEFIPPNIHRQSGWGWIVNSSSLGD